MVQRFDPFDLLKRDVDRVTQSLGRPAPSAVAQELASRKQEALNLLRQAVDAVESENFESALWRAVDAAGLLSFFVHREAVGMPPSPTGRGFFIGLKR